MSKNTYLMLRTKDGRRFITHEMHSETLREFANAFNAEMAVVNVEDESRVLPLDELAPAICDAEYSNDIKIKILKKISRRVRASRRMMRDNASQIRSFIRNRLLSGKSLSLKEIKDQYVTINVTDACLCNHFTQTRKSLQEQGMRLAKIGAGRYCLMEAC